MEKSQLLSFLESEKARFSEKTRHFNESLIESIMEDTRLPNMMDIEDITSKGEVPILPKAKRKERIYQQIEQKEEKEKEEQEKPEKEKSTVKFATDFGVKAILYDNNFINIDEQGLQAISDMFTPQEVKIILNSENWKKLEREGLYCLKPHVDKNSKKIRCFNPRLNRFSYNSGKFILTMYKRMDDDKEVEMIPDPAYKIKDKKTKKPTGEVRKVPYIQMDPAHNEQIFSIQVSPKKYAVVLKLPYQEDPYLFNMSQAVKDFFHKND